MTTHDRRRDVRDSLRAAPPDAGVICVRHAVTGRVVVAGVANLAAARNRFEFAVSMHSGSAIPDLRLAADTRAHGWDEVSFEVLETVPVRPETDQASLRTELEVLAGLWGERLTAETHPA